MGKAAKAPTRWANRIVGHGDEPLSNILLNPWNWRIHPKLQKDALRGAIEERGFLRSVTINRTSGHLIDGHLRVLLADEQGQETIPAEYIEVDEKDEPYILATFDPIASFAATDKEKLDEVLHELASEDAAVQAMLAELARQEGITPPDFQPVGIEEQGRLDQKKPITCPECGASFVPKT